MNGEAASAESRHRLHLSLSAFVVGITGHAKIAEKDQEIIRRRLREVFAMLRRKPGHADHGAGSRSAAARLHLGLENTPIILLSSLAPGADTLAAEVALELGREWKLPNGDPAITVLAPLPFVESLYRRASTFQAFTKDAEGRKVPDENGTRLLQERYDELCHHIKAQHGQYGGAVGGAGGRALFPVLLNGESPWFDGAFPSDADLERSQEPDLLDEDRRHRRYRAAGEYIAAYSDLLIAIWDGAPSSSDCGTDKIVEVKRGGLSLGLIPVATCFTWSDTGPVLHLPVRRAPSSGGTTVAGVEDSSWSTQPLRLLHSYELRPETKSRETLPDDNVTWQERGGRILEQIAEKLERFNAESWAWVNDLQSGDRRFKDETTECHKLVESDLKDNDTKAAKSMHNALRPIAALRRRSSDMTGALDDQTLWFMKLMCVFVVAAGFFLNLYAHWEPEPAKEHHGIVKDAGENAAGHASGKTLQYGETSADCPAALLQPKPAISYPGFPVHLLRAVFLALAAMLAGIAPLLFFFYRRQDIETRRHDYRALSEGLRVQSYWCLSGVGKSVASHYMQRQRGELTWIRTAIASMGVPFHLWRQWFTALSLRTRNRLLHRVKEQWVRGQEKYFQKRGRAHRHALHHLHLRGWGFAVGGLLLLLVLLFRDLSGFASERKALCLQCLAVVGAAALLVILIVNFRQKAGGKGQKTASRDDEEGEVQKTCDVLSFGLLVFTLVMVLLSGIARLPDWDWLPGLTNCWIMLLGLTLLLAGAYIAWAEKRLYAEHARQYGTMASLFRAARLKLESELRELDDLIERGDETTAAKKIGEIQNLLYDLGHEALEENAEWLILHRARPLEPFLAG